MCICSPDENSLGQKPINELNFELQTEYENNLTIFQNAEIFKNKSIPFKTKIASNLFKKIKDKLPSHFIDDINNETIIDFVYSILIALVNWEPIITLFYNQTKTFNIVGVYKDDLDSLDVNISKDSNEHFKLVKNKIIDIIINSWENTTDDKEIIKDNYLVAQLFYTLDSNRFSLNSDLSFKIVANSFIKDTIKKFGNEGTQVLNNVNKNMKEIYFNFTKITLDDKFPPFAFSSKK